LAEGEKKKRCSTIARWKKIWREASGTGKAFSFAGEKKQEGAHSQGGRMGISRTAKRPSDAPKS